MSQTETVREYTVEGMTCAHCVLSVTEEVAEVAGVRASTSSSRPAAWSYAGPASTTTAVRAAVAEAGYEVVA